MRKRVLLTAVVAVAAFAVSYIGFSYGFRLKLSADPLTYFIESMKHMALLKTALSAAIAVLAGAATYFIARRLA